jgi:SAM-dependent methyltransferase
MSFHDDSLQELRNKVSDSDRVLDVGGWHAPWNRADYIIDIMPYETHNREGALLKEVYPEARFTKETFLQMDVCAPKPWPFPDKYFDFVYCSNTLEDLRDPIRVCSEILRVGKAGFIETPSRVVESTRGIERPFYCGYYHHRWLCEVEGKKISFLFKPAMMHAYRRFHLVKPWHKKVNPRYGSVGFFWKESFEFEEKIIIDRDDVQSNLQEFKKTARLLPDLFLPKYSWAQCRALLGKG